MLSKYIKYLGIVLVFLSISYAQTTQWRLLWDPNTESDMYYYKIFRDTHSSPTTQIGTTIHPNTEYIDSDLQPGVQYFYRLKAVDSTELESDYSAEVSAAIPNIVNMSDIAVHQGQSIQLNLNNYLVDPDHNNNDIVWTYTGNSNFSITIGTNNIATITTSSAGWLGSETVTFTATDPDEFFDVQVTTLIVNIVPVVSNITDQTINQGGSFNTITLDNFVDDTDDDDSEITWTTEGNTNLDITINANRIATISAPSPNWYGSETVNFIATDPHGASDNISATFRVNGQPQITRTSPMDQTIEQGQNFESFDLDDYVSDPDHADNELTWQVSGNSQLSVSIDANHIVTINKPTIDWTGSEAMIFTVTDPLGSTNSDTAIFSALEEGAVNTVSILAITRQSIMQGESFEPINLDNYVICDNFLKSQLTWSCTGTTNLHVEITGDRIAHISVVDPNWNGEETLTFRVTTPNGVSVETNTIFVVKQYIFSALNFQLLGSGTVVEVRWITIIPVESRVLYGQTDLSELSQLNSTSSTEHVHIISNLNPNSVYSFQAVGVDANGYEYLSEVQTFETSSESDVNVFPNPYTAGKFPENDVVNFTNLPEGSSIHIYNMLGEPVFNQKDINQLFRWAAVNDYNENVQAGLYLYVVKGSDNKKLTSGKIVIIR
jgi:hypothetical protein